MDRNSYFSDRANGMQRSVIRELLKLTQNPEVISFAGGLPAPETFPIHYVREATTKVLEEEHHLVAFLKLVEPKNLIHTALETFQLEFLPHL